MVKFGVRRLGRRVARRWRCNAIVKGQEPDGTPRWYLAKKKIPRRGFSSWSFGADDADVEQIVRWTAGHTLSKVGQHYLKRRRGVPMGSSISPAKASVALSDMEARGWKNKQQAIRHGFLREGDRGDLRQDICGKRIADDITLMSKELDVRCMKFFARLVFRAPLGLEFEDEGQEVDMADFKIKVKIDVSGNEFLQCRRTDKNDRWLTGEDVEPKRLRFQPWFTKPAVRRVATWIVGRWYDVLRRGGSDDTRPRGVVTTGCIAIVAEFLLMQYPASFMKKVLDCIRQPELLEMCQIGRSWLRLLGDTPASERIQTEFRILLIELGVFYD